MTADPPARLASCGNPVNSCQVIYTDEAFLNLVLEARGCRSISKETVRIDLTFQTLESLSGMSQPPRE